MEFGLMDSTRYIIAKHVSDVFRKEPRNIGVILWSEFGVEARFWATDSYGVVDGRKIPEFVNSKSAYEQWIAFWLNEIKKPQVELIGSGSLIPISSPGVIQAIQSGNSAHFFLDEGGTILEQVTKSQLPALADELFEKIVTADIVDEPDTTALINDACEKVIKTTPLANNKNFYRRRLLFPEITPKVIEKIEFSYFYGNGEPLWLGQQVALKRYKSQLTKEVDSICWRFEKVIKAGFITNEQGAAFIYPTDEQLADEDVTRSIAVLGTVTNVFNLRDTQSAKHEFEKVASIEIPVATN
jgi:hypothetical protein